MCLYRKHGGERGYHGHILNLPQDIQNFLDQLPANINELPALLIRRTTDDGIHMWDERKFLMHYKLITLSTLMLLSGTPIWTNYLKMVIQECPNELSPDENSDQTQSSTSFLPIP